MVLGERSRPGGVPAGGKRDRRLGSLEMEVSNSLSRIQEGSMNSEENQLE